MTQIQQIEQHPVYKMILADSFGGIMYNVANRSKYNTKEIVTMYEQLTDAQRDGVGGIMKGVFSFLRGDES